MDISEKPVPIITEEQIEAHVVNAEFDLKEVDKLCEKYNKLARAVNRHFGHKAGVK